MYSEIKIVIPNNNIEERKYIVDTFFHDLLGVCYQVSVGEELIDYHICFANKKIVFKDHFWNKNLVPLSYINISNFPNVFYAKNQFTVEEDIPILYGDDELIISNNEIVCGIDIFASAFFMISRWEEFVNTERDKHQRFPASASIAFKENFLIRPIVNEYLEMLWNMIEFLGYDGSRKTKSYELFLTHDIDVLISNNPFRTLLADIIKRKDLKLALKKLPSLLKDPVNTFSFLMDVSEKIGVKSHFYFMSVHPDTSINIPTNYLNTYRFRILIKEIIKRGHVIGFHPGYFTFDNKEQWIKEKIALENSIGFKVYEGRQHFLKLDIINTLKIWDEYGMIMDSSLAFADREGYRCGTGDSFHIFDFLKRKKLELIESPLVLMDATLNLYRKLSPEQGKIVIEYFIKMGKKYNMKTVFLFHNSSFDKINWKGWMKIYKDVLLENK